LAAGCRGDIAGHHHDRHAALPDRLADCDFQGARHLIGVRYELAIVAALLEQDLGMRLLEIAAPDLGRGNLRRDGQHRHPRALTIEQAIDQVQVARPAAPCADRELTG
jgi:hypothetical protein